MAALASPPVELSMSGLGSGSRAVIDGGGSMYATHLGLGDPGVEVVESAGAEWLVLDVCLRMGRERLEPVLPEVTQMGSRQVLRVRPGGGAYTVWVRPDLRAADHVRVGPVGAPVESLRSASAFGVQLESQLVQGGELHHRVAVRVDRARRDGWLDFPLVYRLEAESVSGLEAPTNGISRRPQVADPSGGFTHNRRWR
ncbi:MAG: hypothetical protein H6737_26370 [Alphaproteobacteria bacterium]|nr:hypothetical protein [Alphaproteobacteria bacterium]